jgi:hypothetical protein
MVSPIMEIDYLDVTDTGTESDVATTFTALMPTLNLYIDELIRLPEFHRFLDLPIEFRNRVYEYCFLDDDRSLACDNWPRLTLIKANL